LLEPHQVKSAILAGLGDYFIEETELQFPDSWPVPESVPRPLTTRVWAEEGARILEEGKIVPRHLASANLIAARVTGADPKVLAAVIRGAVAPTVSAESLRAIHVPVLILNGKADAANLKTAGLLEAIPGARSAACDGDHHSAPYQPSFQEAIVQFFAEQWALRQTRPTSDH